VRCIGGVATRPWSVAKRGGLVALAGLLVFASCSDADRAGGQTADSTTTTAAGAVTPPGTLYIVDLIDGEIDGDAGTFSVQLLGVQRRTPWLSDAQSGVLSTAGFVDQWDDLGLGDTPPQAALVPADADEQGLFLELSTPTWDEEARVLEFEAIVASEVPDRIAGLVPDPADDPTTWTGAGSLFIYQPGDVVPDEDDGPSPTTTTTSTTTTTTTSTTIPPTPATQDPSTSSIPTTTTTIFVPPPTPPVTPAPPPTGDPRIITSTTAIRLPSAGGSTTFTIRNLGSGVGSWSVNTPEDVGIGVAPSSGVLFPGSSTTILVSYDGSFEVNDFATQLILVTSNGTAAIEVTVAGT
jgi:hypothetical protein